MNAAVSRRHLSYAIAAVAVAAAIAADALTLFGSNAASRGSPAPSLPSEVLVPPRVTIGGLRGRPVAITFWASWCGPCREEAPALARLSHDLGRRASLVGVDWEDSRAAALAFVREYGWTFPVLRASADGLAERYGIVGLPATVVVNPGGRIVTVLQGPQTVAGLKRTLGLNRPRTQ